MTMRLNDMKPAHGARKTRLRVGRGASAGQGKTCGRGVKGQRARKGGYHKVGFEGGQMPIQRRMPKVGFRSKIARTRAEVMLSELAKVEGAVIDLEGLKKAHVIPVFAEKAKVVLSGEIKQAGALIVYRIGTYIPVPGINPAEVARFFSDQSNTILGIVNMFSGGALSRLSIFAMGVMPYISASIIIQMMSMVMPSLMELRKEGE